MDKIRALTVYRKVVELGSFHAAADALQLSKAAVSKNIRELEDYLQTPLIHRTTRSLNITEQGKNYYQQICHILDSLQQADLALIDSVDTLRGQLKISVPMSLGLAEINPLVCAFMAQHPALSVELVLNDHYIDVIAQGFDIAIRGGAALADSSLRARKLLDLKRVLCASPAYLAQATRIQQPVDILPQQCLMYSLAGSQTWRFQRQDQQQDIVLNAGRYTVNNSLALAQTAVLGHGLALLPLHLIRRELADGSLVQVLPEWQVEDHALYIIYPSHKEQSQKIRAFIDFMRQQLQA